MSRTLPIAGLNHVACITRDVPASVRFYRDLLGFTQVRRPNFSFGGAWLSGYGFVIHIIENTAAEGPEGPIETRLNHLAFHTNRLEETAALLAEHGVPFKRNQQADTEVVQLFFRDPGGNFLEIACYPPTPPPL